VVFPANGDDGKVETLLLFLRPEVTLSSSGSLLPLRFRIVTLPPPPGVTFRLDRVVIPDCGGSSGIFSLDSDLSELKRVLRL